LPYWSNPPFFIFDILSARAPECQKLKTVAGLDQYGTEPFKQQQLGKAGVEWVKINVGYNLARVFHGYKYNL